MYTTILPSDNQWYFNMNIESGEKMTQAHRMGHFVNISDMMSPLIIGFEL